MLLKLPSILLGCLIIQNALADKFPSYLPKCKFGDHECVKNAFQFVMAKYAADGLPDINLRSLDPFRVARLDSSDPRFNSNVLNVRMITTDSELVGFRHANYSKAEILRKNNAIKGTLVMITPKLQYTGDYMVSGNVLLVPIEGNGKMNITLLQPLLTVKFLGKLNKTADGDEFLKIDKFRGVFEAQKGFIHFENLFNGNNILGETVNQFLNENFANVFREFSRPIFDILSNILRDVLQDVFDKIPINEMFLK